MHSVDVIVPCYNYGRFLRECIASIRTQDVGLRVLIIDDASTDETQQVAAELVAEDPRIELITHRVNLGHITTYNEGLDWTTSDYVLLISADDLLVPGALRRACVFMDANPHVGFTYGRLIHWKADTPRPPHDLPSEDFASTVIPGREWIANVLRQGRPPTTCPEVLVRTSDQKAIGHYRHDLPHWADVEVLLRLAVISDVGYIDTYQAYYRIHPSNMHRSFTPLSLLTQHRLTFTRFFAENGEHLKTLGDLKYTALGHVADEAIQIAHNAYDIGDVPKARLYCDFAVETNPGVIHGSRYKRLRWKLRAGPRAWKFLQIPWRMRSWFRKPVRYLNGPSVRQLRLTAAEPRLSQRSKAV